MDSTVPPPPGSYRVKKQVGFEIEEEVFPSPGGPDCPYLSDGPPRDRRHIHLSGESLYGDNELSPWNSLPTGLMILALRVTRFIMPKLWLREH